MGEGGGARGNGGEKHKSLGMGKGVGEGEMEGEGPSREADAIENITAMFVLLCGRRKDLSNASSYTVWKWDAL